MATENLIFETADGLQLVMSNDVFAYEMLPANFGAPPTNFITKQGYKQNGVTEVDYILGQRDFELEFWRAPACDRATYWANRADILEYFRPNRNGQMTFTVLQADGTQRSLKVRATPGPVFNTQSDNHWNIRESIPFAAFDPLWFNPAANIISVVSSVSNELVFPITFPIIFGASGTLFVQSITYLGTWASYPTLKLDGPYTSAVITNLTTGFSIYFTVAISAGQSRTLDLTPGAQTLVDENGDDAFGDLGPISNLVDFNIRPDPEVPGGVQTIQAIFYGGTVGISAFTLTYFDRFFGI
jgi:hypothetical protein